MPFCASYCIIATSIFNRNVQLILELPITLQFLQVNAIQSYSQGINKVIDSLQQTFPSISRSQLRNKVRELSEFVDNRWQVSGSHP